VAGALVYTKYDYFKRLVMKLIADRRGGDTDTSKDHEYTDWAALYRFGEGFVSGLDR
jgi:menaquinone-dependent protoporphyrinogen oxidase